MKETTIAVLGLSFKPETDDIRESASMDICRSLIEMGARVRVYDPEAMELAALELPDLILCKDVYDASTGADVLAIVTEWNEFRALDLKKLAACMKRKKIVDLRNIYDAATVRAEGFEYTSMGRP